MSVLTMAYTIDLNRLYSHKTLPQHVSIRLTCHVALSET